MLMGRVGTLAFVPACLLGVLQAQTGITVTPRQLSLAAPAGSTASVSQTVTVSSTSSNSTYTSSIRYLTPVTGWLSASPASGNLPAAVTVTANPTGLKEGSHLGQVLITSGPYVTYLDVLFVVGSGAADSTLTVSPTALTFIANASADEVPPETVNVGRVLGPDSTSLSYQVIPSSDGNWLSVYPWSGSTPGTISAVANSFGLAPGKYFGTIALIPQTGNPRIIPATLLVLGSTPVPDAIYLDQTSITINYQTGTGDIPLQTVGVTTTPSSRPYTVVTTTPWLKVVSAEHPTPASSIDGISPGAFSIQADPTGLVPGTYVGKIEVNSAGLTTQELPVTLRVAAGPAFNADPSSLVFSDQGITAAILTLTGTGGANLAFSTSVQPNAPWLQVTPASGSTGASGVGLQITATTTGLAPGTYNGVVSVTGGSAGTLNIPVRLQVVSNSGAGTLVPEMSFVSLSGVIGGPNPSQTLAIGTSVAGISQDFTVSATSTGGWLLVEPFRGTAPGNIIITANLANIPKAGTHEASVDLVSLLTGDKQKITVNLLLSVEAISASPASLVFTQAQYGVPPDSQTLRVTSNLAGNFSVISAPSWAKTNPASGSTPADIRVSVDSKGLPPGENNGIIGIAGPKNELKIPITFKVVEAPGPTVTPSSVQLSYKLGAPPPAPEMLSVASNTTNAVGFVATPATASGVNWLGVSPAGGLSPAVIAVSVIPGSLTPGTHLGTITVSSTDQLVKRTVPVNLNVSASAIGTHSVLHAATLAPSPAAPGLLVTITGSGLGPEAGVTAKPTAAGAIDTQLAGTQVFFDGVPAPLLYVRNDQVNAIVPYSVYGRATVKVQVQRGADYALPIEMRVVDSAPGIFTAASSGRGQAAALNADMTVNSTANPAPRGGVISIFISGEGQTDPPGQDGRIILTDLRRPLLPVTATIGGQPAEVLYAGSAPTIVSGVAQVNLRIPENIDAGTASVAVQSGAAVSQPGVTIAVR